MGGLRAAGSLGGRNLLFVRGGLHKKLASSCRSFPSLSLALPASILGKMKKDKLKLKPVEDRAMTA